MNKFITYQCPVDQEFEKELQKYMEKAKIAATVAYYRKKRHLSRTQLAQLAGISPSTISKIENLYLCSPTTLAKIMDTLGLEFVAIVREKTT